MIDIKLCCRLHCSTVPLRYCVGRGYVTGLLPFVDYKVLQSGRGHNSIVGRFAGQQHIADIHKHVLMRDLIH